MQVSKQIIKDAGMHPKLKLMRREITADGKVNTIPTGPHRVKLIKDKEVTKTDSKTGKPVDYIRYLVEENGDTKIYDTRKFNKDTGDVSYLVAELAQYPEGSVVILEAKKEGIKNFISVKPVTTAVNVEIEENEEDEDIEE